MDVPEELSATGCKLVQPVVTKAATLSSATARLQEWIFMVSSLIGDPS
jgi:hypothetical protein